MNAQLEFPMATAQPVRRRESDRIYAAVKALRARGFEVIRTRNGHRIIDRGHERYVTDAQLVFFSAAQIAALPELSD